MTKVGQDHVETNCTFTDAPFDEDSFEWLMRAEQEFLERSKSEERDCYYEIRQLVLVGLVPGPGLVRHQCQRVGRSLQQVQPLHGQ